MEVQYTKCFCYYEQLNVDSGLSDKMLQFDRSADIVRKIARLMRILLVSTSMVAWLTYAYDLCCLFCTYF